MNKRKMYENAAKEVFIFFRKEGFYPVFIPRFSVEDNAKCNPGTLRVKDLIDNVVWPKEETK